MESYSTNKTVNTSPTPDGGPATPQSVAASEIYSSGQGSIQLTFDGPYGQGGSGSQWDTANYAEIKSTGEDPYGVENGGELDGESGLFQLSQENDNGDWQTGGPSTYTPYGYNLQVRVTTNSDSSSYSDSSPWSASASTSYADPLHPDFPPAPVLTSTPVANEDEVLIDYTAPAGVPSGTAPEFYRLLPDGVVTYLGEGPDSGSPGLFPGGPTGSQIFAFYDLSLTNSYPVTSGYYSLYSNFVPDVGTPVTPLHLTATPTNAKGVGPVNLLFDNTPDNESAFTVQRSTQLNGNGTLLTNPYTLLPGGGTTSSTTATSSETDIPAFVDKGAVNNSYFLEGETYYYSVAAGNDNGQSPFSFPTALTFPEFCMTCSGGQLSATGDQSNAASPSLSSSTGGWSAGGTISTTGSTTKPLFIAQLNGGNDGQITVVYGPGQQTFFALNSLGVYVEKFGGTDTLTHADGQFILTDAGGNKSKFSDTFTITPAGPESQVTSTSDAAGNSANVTGNSDGNPTEVQIHDANGNETEDWIYTYIPSGDANAGLLESVSQDVKSGSSFVPSRILNYTYYDGSSPNDGSVGDIRSAAITDGSGNVIDDEYYRYYVPGDSGGNVHQLKFQIGNDSIGRLETANSTTDLDSIASSDLAPYADIYLGYNAADQVVTRTLQGEGCSACAGGQGTYAEQYYTSGNSPGVNSWTNKTVETQPDGNQNISYFNSDGQLMLSIYKDTTSGQMWGTFTEYDDSTDLPVLVASPSAVNLPASLATIEQYSNLLHLVGGSGVSANYQYLNSTTGLITLTGYTSFGDVASTSIKQGEDGPAIPQESIGYVSHSDGSGDTINLMASDTTYGGANSADPRTTTYDYPDWFSNTLQPTEEITTLPPIFADQNGPATISSGAVSGADTSTEVFNKVGEVVWSKDADGFITYNAYDPISGGLIKTIQDVNLTNTSDYDATYLPSGWTTPTNGGLNLVTTSVVDSQGRATETTSPDGNVTYTVYNDGLNSSTGFENEVRTYPGWHEITSGDLTGNWTTTGPVTVTRSNVPGSYSETLTYAYTPVSGVSTPTGTDTISSSNIQSLARQLTSAGGQMVESDAYVSLSGVTYSSAVHLGSAYNGTTGNYDATTYGFDTDGNQNKVTDPNGTITRTVNDGQGRAVSTWIGTSDAVASGTYWSPSNHGNMTEVSSNIYDNGGVGDGDLTETVQYPDGATGERATLNYYDWRDRLVTAKSGALVDSSGTPTPSAETDGTNRPISYSVYDNADEPVTQETFDGDGVTISLSSGVPNAPSSSLLTGKTTTSYDDQGRAFKTQTFSVTAGNGTVSSTALTGESFYDLDGNVIAQAAPGGAWTKTAYDGADRPITTYTTDGGAIAGATGNWTNANSIANDVVLSQIDTTYDGDGNVILTADHERLPGDAQSGNSSIGALGNATGSGWPAANVYYTAAYFDAADRPIAGVDVGTNGGSAYTPPSSVPSSSDTTLVSTTAYGANGMPSISTDPRGIQSFTGYDLLGQTKETIAAYTDGTPTDSTNQTTLYKYDGNGNEISMTAVLPSGNQTTDYIYSVSTSTGSSIFSNDLLGTVEYPNASNGAASSAAADDVTYTDDALGEVTGMTDQNGTTHDYTYDSLGRETLDSVTHLGSGVDGSVMALGTSYNSQGLPFQETSYSNGNGTGVVNQDQDVYNGLGQLTGEFQSVSGEVNTLSTPEVQYTFSDPSLGSRPTGMEYPNGRVIDYIYNSGIDTTIGRVSGIADAAGSAAGNLQSYAYQGVGTIVGYTDGNGVTETTTLDSFDRDAEIKYVSTDATGSPTTDDFAYGYDRDGNVLYQDNLLNGNFSQLYHASGVSEASAYDQLNRLTGFEQGALSASGGTGTTLDTVSTANQSQSWNLNAVGDQNTVTTGNATVTNSTNAKNELTTNGNSTLTFDNNGNTLTDENGVTYTFDAWNHEATVKSGNTTLAVYTNDPTGRRVTETSGNTTTAIYFSNQWQPIELRQGGTVTSQNVFGLGYVNQLVERDDNSTSGSLGKSGSGLGERLYAQQNLNWSTTTLVDSSGNVVQRMVYMPFGGVIFLTNAWAAGSNTAALRSLYQGGWLETADGTYSFQRRDYDPATGIWREPDPTGYPDGANELLMERANPVIFVDATGTRTAGNDYTQSGGTVALKPQAINGGNGGAVSLITGATLMNNKTHMAEPDKVTAISYKSDKQCLAYTWVQFFWSEIILKTAKDPDGSALSGDVATNVGPVPLTTKGGAVPKWQLDSTDPIDPSYEGDGSATRGPNNLEITIFDSPSALVSSVFVKNQIDAHPDWTEFDAIDHYQDFLVSDKKIIYMVAWTSTSVLKKGPPESRTGPTIDVTDYNDSTMPDQIQKDEIQKQYPGQNIFPVD